MNRRLCGWAFACVLWLCLLTVTATAASADYTRLIDETVAWRTGDRSDILEGEATESLDWYAMALGRYDRAKTAAYAAALPARVTALYAADNVGRITDWQRLALTVAATGGDPTAIGGHNLLADATYARDLPTLGRQGINGYIFALLALDSVDATVPTGAATTREMLLEALLDAQLADGGWALTGSVSDVDMTAMALQALAPYADQTSTAIDRALTRLSALQRDSGGFASYGTENAESSAQVLLALCSLGIDPAADARFIRNEHTVIDALSAYHTADGGWAHVPGGKANDVASRQALCALVALWRQQQGLPGFYRAAPLPAPTTTPASSSAATAAVTTTTSHTTTAAASATAATTVAATDTAAATETMGSTTSITSMESAASATAATSEAPVSDAHRPWVFPLIAVCALGAVGGILFYRKQKS